MKLIFATNNQHKADEIRLALPPHIEVVTLREAGIGIEIPEPHETLKENAAEKALTIVRFTGTDAFSEDAGLEVDALGGAPGVRSARFAGEERSDEKNMEKLLSMLEGRPDRRARFRAVFCLSLKGRTHFFEGVCEGRIATGRKGREGFGYDPVFIPDGSDLTFAEMGREGKNRFSHRRKVADMLVEFLNNLTPNE